MIAHYELETRARAILISPVLGQIDLQELAAWVAASDLNVRLQIQMHKVIWGAEAKGV